MRIDQHSYTRDESLWAFLARHWAKKAQRTQDGRGPMPEWNQAQGTIKPQVDRGRWIVICPRAEVGCGGATMMDVEEPYYVCVECGSPENQGFPYQVVFPRARVKIEEVLLWRPDKRTQNWHGNESVADLQAENIEHGVNA